MAMRYVYRVSDLYRPLVGLLFGLGSAGVVVFVVLAFRFGWIVAIGAVFLFLQVLRLRNWYLFRIVTVIELSEGVLHWATPRRSGEVSLTQITAVRPLQRTVPRMRFPAWDSALVQIDVSNADPIILWERTGFVEFVDVLRHLLPHLPIQLARRTTWGISFGGPSGFSTHSD
jgi:hypothetical protein